MSEEWKARYYGSGTSVVTMDMPSRPLFYVFGPRWGIQREWARQDMCEELCAFLNGGDKPAWLYSMIRTSANEVEGLDGSSVSACGPIRLISEKWEDISDAPALTARRELIDRLVTPALRR